MLLGGGQWDYKRLEVSTANTDIFQILSNNVKRVQCKGYSNVFFGVYDLGASCDLASRPLSVQQRCSKRQKCVLLCLDWQSQCQRHL